MRQGRPPKPGRLRELTGNAGRRPIPVEPKISRRRPTPPPWLTDYARQAFEEVVDELFAAGIVVAVDVWVLSAFAEFAATARSATETLQKLAVGDAGAGLVARMPSGAITLHPLLAVKNRAWRDVVRVASELGLSPCGRVGLPGIEPADDTDLEVLRKYRLLQGAADEEVGHA